MASVTRHFPLIAGFFLSLDSRASATYVRVPEGRRARLGAESCPALSLGDGVRGAALTRLAD
jgi:hypothetical protein